jgi:hypothetical protein
VAGSEANLEGIIMRSCAHRPAPIRADGSGLNLVKGYRPGGHSPGTDAVMEVSR